MLFWPVSNHQRFEWNITRAISTIILCLACSAEIQIRVTQTAGYAPSQTFGIKNFFFLWANSLALLPWYCGIRYPMIGWIMWNWGLCVLQICRFNSVCPVADFSLFHIWCNFSQISVNVPLEEVVMEGGCFMRSVTASNECLLLLLLLFLLFFLLLFWLKPFLQELLLALPAESGAIIRH